MRHPGRHAGGAALALASIAVPAFAQQATPAIPGALYPTVTVASEYRYDGTSSSSGNPVAQASLYWWRPDHNYAGVFVSTVDYSGFYDPDTSHEIDVYAGHNWDFGQPYFEMGGDATRLTLEGMYTFFPDQGPPGPTFDFFQAKAAIQHRSGPLTLRAETAYVPEASYGAGYAVKAETGAKYKLNGWLTVSGEYGYREAELRADRSWWDFGATATFGQLAIDLRYYDTDLDYAECGFSENCKPAVVGSVSWNFWKG
jgi:uncharacterized protein (TIGR02001 family)